MYEAINRWFQAIAAAGAIDRLQREIKNIQAGGPRNPLQDLVAETRANPVKWKLLKELQDASRWCQSPDVRWKRLSFNEWRALPKGEKRAWGEGLVDAVDGWLQEQENQRLARIPKLEQEIRNWRAYKLPGVKPVPKHSKEFKLDLREWPYFTDKMTKLCKEKIRKYWDQYPKLTDVKRLKARALKLIWKRYDPITVQVGETTQRDARASWTEGLGMITFYGSFQASLAQAKNGEIWGRSLRHELRHMGQSILAYALGTRSIVEDWESETSVKRIPKGRRPSPGMPSKRLMDPEILQEGSQERKRYERSMKYLMSRGIYPKQIHDLDDLEFYTALADSVEAFESLDLAGWNAREKALAIRIFSDELPHPYSTENRLKDDEWERLDPRGKVRDSYIRSDATLKIWFRHNRGKWRKAVKELTKAVL